MRKTTALTAAAVLSLSLLSACRAPFSAPPAGADPGKSNEVVLTKDEALEKALEAAGLKEDEVTLVSLELDKNLTFSEYEIEFISGGYEYEVDVDAGTGEIRDFEKSTAD